MCYTERITKRKHMVKVIEHQNKTTKERIFSLTVAHKKKGTNPVEMSSEIALPSKSGERA
jgi:hypothetical protein